MICLYAEINAIIIMDAYWHHPSRDASWMLKCEYEDWFQIKIFNISADCVLIATMPLLIITSSSPFSIVGNFIHSVAHYVVAFDVW